MILLLDAHVLVLWAQGGESLAEPARRSIADPANDVLVSAASVWELSIKQELGKIRFDVDLAETIEHAGFSALPVTIADAVAAGALPRHHRDPFDRMLVAQALRIDAIVVSRDRAFAAYGVHQLLA